VGGDDRDGHDDGRLALAALVFGAVVIATTPILVRLAACGPAAAGFWRLAFAAPLLFAAVWTGPRPGPGAPSPAMWLAGVAFALDLACWHYGIRLTSVANATVLPNLTPVLVTPAGWLFLRERPRPVFLIGMACAVCGAVRMALASPAAHSGAAPRLGDALSAATAVWYGLYFLFIRIARRGHATSRVVLWTCLAGAPPLLAIAWALHEPLLPATASGWVAVAALGVVHVAGQGAIAWALGRLPAATASVTVLVQPVIAAALAYWLFGEALTPLQAVAGAAALAGVVLAQQAPAWLIRRPRLRLAR